MIRLHPSAAEIWPRAVLLNEEQKVIGITVPVQTSFREERTVSGFVPAQVGCSSVPQDVEVYRVSEGAIVGFPDGSPIPPGAERHMVPKLERALAAVQDRAPGFGDIALAPLVELVVPVLPE